MKFPFLSISLFALSSLLCGAVRREAIAQLETPLLKFTITDPNGGYEIADKRAKVRWRPSSQAVSFGTVSLWVNGQLRRVELTAARAQAHPGEIVLAFHPNETKPQAALQLRVRALPDHSTLEVGYEADSGLGIESVTPLPGMLTATDTGKGYVVVPVREGLLIPADSGLSFTNRFDTYAYEGCHMAMFGAVQNGAAAMVSWDDPYPVAEVRSEVNPTGPGGVRQQVSPALVLRQSARSFRVHFLGQGDYVSIGQAYREVARQKGYWVGWDQKLKDHPDRAKLLGAVNIKLWSALDRRMNEASTKEESVRVNWTFEEAAQVAEHLKRDLRLDKVLFTVGGWIHRGYDNQHPDILPTAPECGSDQAFADLARRVMDQGYLFCLHDNYQDIYRDSPSWDERYVMKTYDGKLSRGGHWAGGLAFLTCSQMALELAQRPQNLGAVKKLSNANSYFIDTTYASGLQECFDPNHKLSRADDMKWKQVLSDYARKVFGVFGSECGREWAIPHSDFFEGLTGVSGTYYHDGGLPAKVGGTVVPLFEIVYRECIAMYGKYEYDIHRAAPYVLHHLALGRPLNHHSMPAHLYWRQREPEETELPLQPGVAEMRQTGTRQFEITYEWTVRKPVAEDWRVFVHFVDGSGNIAFQDDRDPKPPVSKWQAGRVKQGPFKVEVPPSASGTFGVRMGLFNPGTDTRAALEGRDKGDRRYSVGRLTVTTDQIRFQPANLPNTNSGDSALFTRADNGWAAGLHPMDRFIKNSSEVLDPLNEFTARLPMSRHEFLTPDRKVQRSVFGNRTQACTVIVNSSDTDYACRSKAGGKVVLPPYGFLVETPQFIAFHARNWKGLKFATPTLFTLRSLDGRPIASSRQVRVFHAFGDSQIRLRDKTVNVEKEATLSF
jgi:hypothetical protein